MLRALALTAVLGGCIIAFGGGGGGALARSAAGPTANVFVSPGGSDSAPGCRRLAEAQAFPPATSACRSVGKALALAQPGDVVQLLPGDYGSLTISRQSGSDAQKVVVRGDPSLGSQRSCWQGCATGNVTVSNLNVCGHGLSIRNLDSTGDYDYVYVGDNSCPGSNKVESTFNDELVNVHFNAGTLRGHDLALIHSRLGPNARLCDQPEAREDNLHIWPDTSTNPWTVPYDITLDGNLIYGADMPSSGCGGAHADLIQTLGYRNLTIENNIFWHCAHSFIQDGTISGTGFSGTVVIRNNMFSYCVASGGGYTQLGSVDGGGPCTASYTIENNTWATSSNVILDCSQSPRTVWRDNYIHVGSSASTTCGSGTWDHNVFDPAGITCGDAAAKCRPTWLWPTAAGGDAAHGADLHLAPNDHCLRGAGDLGASPTTKPLADLDGDGRPFRAAVDVGADQRESARVVPGVSIGQVTLGESQDAVEQFYGVARHRASRLATGQPTADVATYTLHGGTLWVAYAEKRVVGVGTTSPYYTTASGVGVRSATSDASTVPNTRAIACKSAFVVAKSGVVTSFIGKATRAVTALSVVRAEYAAPPRCG
jgi:hypothetical protein